MTTHAFKIGDPVQLSDIAYDEQHSLSMRKRRPRGVICWLSSDGVSIGVKLGTQMRPRIDHFRFWMPCPERTVLARP